MPAREDLERILHDLRGPLNSVVMHVEVLKRALADDPDALASVATIQHQLSRLAAMLPGDLEVLALERGQVRRTSLRGLVDRALAEHGLTGVEVADGDWPDVAVDGDLVVVAIAHLVRNAVAATRAAGRADTRQPDPEHRPGQDGHQGLLRRHRDRGDGPGSRRLGLLLPG